MRNLILFTVLLVSSFVSAQIFDFTCDVDPVLSIESIGERDFRVYNLSDEAIDVEWEFTRNGNIYNPHGVYTIEAILSESVDVDHWRDYGIPNLDGEWVLTVRLIDRLFYDGYNHEYSDEFVTATITIGEPVVDVVEPGVIYGHHLNSNGSFDVDVTNQADLSYSLVSGTIRNGVWSFVFAGTESFIELIDETIVASHVELEYADVKEARLLNVSGTYTIYSEDTPGPSGVGPTLGYIGSRGLNVGVFTRPSDVRTSNTFPQIRGAVYELTDGTLITINQSGKIESIE